MNEVDYRGYFRYKEKIYLPGTIVKFNKDWLVAHKYPLYTDTREYCNVNAPLVRYGECIYGKFKLGSPTKKYYFQRAIDEQAWNRVEFVRMIYDWIDPLEIENAIEEIVEIEHPTYSNFSIRPQELKKQPKKKWNQVPEVKILVVIYIMLMLASLIFTQPWGAWLGLTIIFYILIHNVINSVSGNGGL